MKLLLLALAISLCLPLGAQTSRDLVQNGDPETLPDKTFPRNKYEVDSGALKFFLDPGSKAVPGWTVTRNPIILYDWEESNNMPKYAAHAFCMHGNGGLQQVIGTAVGHHYRLAFRTFPYRRDPDQKLKVHIGDGKDDREFVAAADRGPDGQMAVQTILFTATSPQTTVEFYAANSTQGPWLSDIHAFEY